MVETHSVKNTDMTCPKASNRLLIGIGMFMIFLLVSNIMGCQTYTDPIRQHELCKARSRQYLFQQVPATAINPAQYRVCGDNCYPCKAYTAWGTPHYFYTPRYRYHHHVKHKASQRTIKPAKPKAANVAKKEINQITKNTPANSSSEFLSPLKPTISSPLPPSVRNFK